MAPTFCREVILIAAVADKFTDEVFTHPVVGSGIDEIDSAIEDRMKDLFGVFFVDLRASKYLPADGRAAKAQLSDFHPCSPEGVCW